MQDKVKPIGRRAYGSIPHLIGSKRGPKDRGVTAGVSDLLTYKKRGKHDYVIVQEKLDGSNHAVAKHEGRIIPLQRSGYNAWTSPYAQSHMFAQYVADHEDRFDAMLEDGMRVCGEWMIMAHGAIYDLNFDPFVPFDFMYEDKRVPFAEYQSRIDEYGWETLSCPTVISMGVSAPVAYIDKQLGTHGFHGCLEEAEGAVWRLETHGEFNIIAKYVRATKVVGKYLTRTAPPVWNNILPKHQHLINDYSGSGA